MTDALLPAPASICSQEVDCKWVRRSIGGSVLRLDIACNTVSVDMNIKPPGDTQVSTSPPGTARHSIEDGTTHISHEIGQQNKSRPLELLKEKHGQSSPVAVLV